MHLKKHDFCAFFKVASASIQISELKNMSENFNPDDELRPLNLVYVDGRYQHYKKGTIYRVLNVATHTEDEGRLVIYQEADNPEGTVWARPIEMFVEQVPYNFQLVNRFQYIDADTVGLNTDTIELKRKILELLNILNEQEGSWQKWEIHNPVTGEVLTAE